MELACLQEDLSKGLGIVGRAVASRSALPVLSNVMLSTDDGRLRLSATNLEIGINCWIGAKVEEDGAITVPAQTFTALVNSLPHELIDLKLVKDTLKLECMRHKSNLKGIDAEEFPILPTVNEDEGFTLPTSTFVELAKSTIVSAATDEGRPILAGVQIQLNESGLIMAAADGVRLSECATTLHLDIEPTSVIVPANSLRELVHISSGDTMRVILRENQVVFQTENVSLITQLIAGKFPDYRQIIPTRFDTQTTVITKDLRRACAMTHIIAKEVADYVKFAIGQNEVVLTAKAEIGDNKAEIDAQVEGDSLTFAINVKYLLDVLSVISSDTVILETTDASSPIAIKPQEGTILHVIMPMSVTTI